MLSDVQNSKPFYLANLFKPERPEEPLPSKPPRNDPCRLSPQRYAKPIHNPRESWHRGSIIEIFSRTYNSWFTGKIEGVGYDEDSEFFEIHYTNHNNGKTLIKYINRYDPHLRSIQTKTPILQKPKLATKKRKEKKKQKKRRNRSPGRGVHRGEGHAPQVSRLAQRLSKGPKRNSIKKTLGLNVKDQQKGLLPQNVIDQLIKERAQFNPLSTNTYPTYDQHQKGTHRKIDEVIDGGIKESGIVNTSSVLTSSICSETLQLTESANCWEEEDTSFNEIIGGDCFTESDESSARLAWLDAEDFQTFFRCRLSGFLRRVQYYE